MQFSLLKEIFGQPWQIEASTFQRYFPLAVSILRGTQFTPEAEPAENIPYKLNLSVSENGAVQWDDDDDDYSDDESQDQPVNQPVISIIPVRGIMMKHDMFCGPAGTRTIGKRLRNADTDENVVGHILIFETGGGCADSVPELAEAIEACTKPVDGMMCSAGQYAGSYCDEIIASRPEDLVGSIGTMMIWEGRKANSGENEEGVIHQRIYADDATQKNEEYETAINNNNFKLVKERILNPHNEKFISDIRKNRQGVKDNHLHGRAFYASEVVGSLIDSIGDFNYAVDRVLALANYQPEPQAATQSGSSAAADNSKVTHMKYVQIQRVLGSEPLEFEADGRRTFTDEEMLAVNDALAAQQNDTLQTALDAEKQTVSSLQEQFTQIQSGLAETENQLEGANQLVNQLQEENASLKKAPAAAPAVAATVTEPPIPEEKKEKAISDKYENPMDALQEISETYLNHKI
jgi:ClpP class serine protease